jgi:SOS response regulatory protein OraA/RecX
MAERIELKQELMVKIAEHKHSAIIIQQVIDKLTECGLDWDNITIEQAYHIRRIVGIRKTWLNFYI